MPGLSTIDKHVEQLDCLLSASLPYYPQCIVLLIVRLPFSQGGESWPVPTWLLFSQFPHAQ
jgi:hypothetical protein